MGSAVSVNNYCQNIEDICCPEETKSLDPIINDNSFLNQEEENPSNNKDNSNYNNNKITNLFIVNNEENNISNSIINIEENKEKDKDKNNLNKIDLNNIPDKIPQNDIDINEKKKKKITFEYSKKSKLQNTNTVNKVMKVDSEIKPNLRPKSKSIKIKEKNKNIIIINAKNKNQIMILDNENSKIEKNKTKNKVQFNIKKKSEIKTNFEEEKNQKNSEHNNNDNNNNNCINKLSIINKNQESIFDSVVVKNNSSNLLNYIFETINVSEESFRSVELKSNKFQSEFPKFSLTRPLDNDFIKGNFLLKKMKFKYKGDKDLEGKKFGFGIITYEDSSKIKGNFFDSKLNGIVYFYNCGLDNSTYIGEYKNNIPVGYGLYSRQGLKLEGMNWNKNYINDIGIAIWENGEIYEGEFKNNLKEGLGTYRWEDGAIYMGHFQNNQIDGYGFMNFANGNRYEGEFSDGYISGWGRFNWEDGKCYFGNYKKNKKNGFGIFISSYDPMIALIGFWEKGKQNGLFVNLVNGYSKYYFYQNSKKITEIGFQGDICRYLRPAQMKYKQFFKRSYHQLEYFIKSSTK